MIEFEINTNKKQIDFEVTQGIPKYVPANFQSKNITITENGTTEVVADHGYDGLAKVSVEANVKDNSLLNVIKGLNSFAKKNYTFELTADMFDENITMLPMYRFYGNKNIIKVEIPNSITSIGEATFKYCSNITNVTIPNSVTSIGEGAFGDCTALQILDFRSATRVPTVQSHSFSYVPTTCKFIIPDELYDSWIASTNWVSLYNNGYQFIKASEYTEA